MNTWLTSALDRAASLNDWLAPERRQSLERLQAMPWPTRKTEAWRYFSLRPVEEVQFATEAAGQEAGVEISVEAIDGLDSLDLVFVNGRLESGSDDLPEGVTVVALSEADGAQQAAAKALFARVKPERHVFGLVNDVLAADGILVDVADGVRMTRPLRVVHLQTAGVESHVRVLVQLGEGASVTVIEQGQSDQAGFSTLVSEYRLAADAALEHYRLALHAGESLSIGGCHISLADRAKLNSTVVGFGSKLARLDMDVAHDGEHAEAKLNAIYLLDQGELFDLHTTIEHARPNGTTEENVRGIVGDRSRAVFNGRIHIHPQAQKTLAELNNRNLLLSDRAEINTKPELEIYADDVRCAHGATVAEIDKKALYYLQSRGVSRAQAQVMLNFGFINELVDDMPNEALAEWLRPRLRARFAQMEVR